jgi:hypothetical protein
MLLSDPSRQLDPTEIGSGLRQLHFDLGGAGAAPQNDSCTASQLGSNVASRNVQRVSLMVDGKRSIDDFKQTHFELEQGSLRRSQSPTTPPGSIMPTLFIEPYRDLRRLDKDMIQQDSRP